MYMYMYICKYIFVYIHTYIYVFIYIYLHLYTYIHIFIYLYIFILIYLYICKCGTRRGPSFAHAHTHTSIHTHTHTHTTQPKQSFMFTSQQPDFRKVFYYPSVQMFQNLCGGSDAPESKPPHENMQLWFYYSSWLADPFPFDKNGRLEMFCTSLGTSSQKVSQRGWPLNVFASWMGSEGH